MTGPPQISPRSGKKVLGGGALLVVAMLTNACNRGDHPEQVGTIAPDFTIHDGSQTLSLNQYRGKTVVLNFWASWCTYCAAEWPSLEQLPQEVPNLVVLAVAFDSDPSDYAQYVSDYHLHNMIVVLDRSNRSNFVFGTSRPPETYIIGPQGRIRRKFIGAQDWSSPEILNYLRSM